MAPQDAGGTRTIIITGGSSGIGLGAATAILEDDRGPWHVVLPVRNAARGQEAVAALAATATNGNTVEAMTMDLSSLASVREFATELTGRVTSGAIPRIFALVCNAGVQMGTNLTHTTDGFEATFGVNHLGHFALVNALLPVLEAPARVVVTASGVHDPALRLPGPPAWNDAEALARGELGPAAESDNAFVAGQRRYSTSKLANMYFTYALARRLPEGVTANAFDPGMVLGTGLGRSLPAPVKFLSDHVFPRLTWLLRRTVTSDIRTAEESGSALAWLATAPELATTTGTYFGGRTEMRSSDESYEVARAEQLWADSEKLTGARV
ncbi:SDR family NAD(P)-dependent oxidoreductase [Myceligenerans pegani]|uniref:SDR family NAD(P)-dependent oxidoreductase n=1 Tax=Myceligenerans pegani TaxID=2776917 RepID=A0ABR9N6Z0_9MICO|nr:SDR family NAD(P)-dependent oxidoreductase [Myceligenerans sp. TRM 65318]MBE1878812.1 SDR family NAD(P)-dependent oxidoreductase [Myceligenerans sp. TRM 65318]MBE3021083.1 SDR family NAD(P)-dependent oxidoreductase [Myceligenerans sp. TRM 65318]